MRIGLPINIIAPVLQKPRTDARGGTLVGVACRGLGAGEERSRDAGEVRVWCVLCVVMAVENVRLSLPPECTRCASWFEKSRS